MKLINIYLDGVFRCDFHWKTIIDYEMKKSNSETDPFDINGKGGGEAYSARRRQKIINHEEKYKRIKIHFNV